MKNIDRHKPSDRSEKYRFVDYLKENIGYYFYHPTQQKVFVGWHAIFLKKEFIQKRGSGRSVGWGVGFDPKKSLSKKEVVGEQILNQKRVQNLQPI